MISQLGQSDYFYSITIWQEENMGKPKSAHKTTHTDNLVKAVRAMGISFQIWTKKDSKEKDWTSLMGNEKKKLLKDLPAKFHEGGKQESARKFPRLTESREDHNQQTSTQTPPVQYNERELKSMKVPQLCNILEVELGLSVGRGKRKQELIEMICQFHARSQ